MRLNVGSPDTRAPHAEGGFRTPSGKCEFKASMAEGGNFVVPVWRSMYEDKQKIQGDQRVHIHPMDAADRGIEPGDPVVVFNDRGSFAGCAQVTTDVMPGVVMANVGHRPSVNRSGTSVNAISSDRHSTLGQAGSYCDNLVEVARGAALAD